MSVGVLTKISGLWRWDGDDEPVTVSRRSFFFMGGMAAAGAVLWPFGESNVLATFPAGLGQTVLLRVAEIDRALGIITMEPTGEWLRYVRYHYSPNAGEWLGLKREDPTPPPETLSDLHTGWCIVKPSEVRAMEVRELSRPRDERWIVRRIDGELAASDIEVYRRRLVRGVTR